MMSDGIAEARQSVPQSWLYRCSDRSPFAYARGNKFIRYGDHMPWALAHDDRLFSLRSGACLAYLVGTIYYDATSDEPLFYTPSSVALPGHPPCREPSAVWATHNASPHRIARTVTVPDDGLVDRARGAPAGADTRARGYA